MHCGVTELQSHDDEKCFIVEKKKKELQRGNLQSGHAGINKPCWLGDASMRYKINV